MRALKRKDLGLAHKGSWLERLQVLVGTDRRPGPGQPELGSNWPRSRPGGTLPSRTEAPPANSIVEMVLGEHAMIRVLLNELASRLKTAPCDTPSTKAMAGLVATALLSHASLEEEVLLPHLDAALGNEGLPMLMRREHHALELSWEQASKSPWASPADRLPQFLALAREHLAREERVLLPAARILLTALEQQVLGRRWACARGLEFPSPRPRDTAVMSPQPRA